MPNVTYALKPQGPKPWLIILFFYWRYDKFQYSTGEKIDPKFWDKSKFRAKTGKAYPAGQGLNYLLDGMDIVVQNAFRKWMIDTADEEVTMNDLRKVLKAALDKFMKKDIARAENNFFDFVESYIDQLEGSKQLTASTLKAYRKAKNLLQEYEKTFRKPFSFDTFTLEWSLGFQEWCFSAPRNYSTNYCRRIIKYLKKFLSEAEERELHSNQAYKSRRFNIGAQTVDHIYLNEDELNELVRLDVSGYLDKARDLFIFGCYTGLRFSDFSKLKPENFIELDGEQYIQVITQKTGERVTIPIHPNVYSIMEKWGGPPPGISGQKLNLYLKELAGKCDWGKSSVLVRRSVAGERVDQKVKKLDIWSNWC